MADDVNVSKIEELSVYSHKINSFAESMTHNCVVICDIMAQKIEQLEAVRRRAKSVRDNIEMQRAEYLDYYASVAGDSRTRNLGELQDELAELQRKERDANRYYGEIVQHCSVAKNMLISMIQQTKYFQSHSAYYLEKGRNFVKSSIVSLIEYKDNSRKV